QEYFSDGMTEAIIRGLSRVPKFFVIARNSAFVYKGRAVKVQRVGRELGVRYVLEGSVQRSGRRVRITAQLIDALTGRHIWSQKFDRDLKNIFALQDEITMKIMNAMRIELTEGEQARLRAERAPTRNLEAYELYLQGIGRMNRLTRAGNTAARKLLQRAIHLDPNFASAHATLGFAHFYDCLWGWTTTPKSSLMSAAKHSRQALALSPDLDVPYVVLGFVYAFMRKHDQAVASLERAVALNPNSSFAFAGLAVALIWSSQDRQALAAVKKSIRLNPFPMANHYQILGMAHMWLKQYSQAIVAYKKALARNPAYFWAWNSLVYIYVQLGRLAEAKAALTRLLKVKPDFSLALVATRPYKDPARNKALIEALKKAGLKMKGRP
ncbi:MAG: tetratricopeptide repeat protein, partial [Proteobacteria bacterium]|nr:tetratricopeptide repeat protein [Pseudomonadota bacterium]